MSVHFPTYRFQDVFRDPVEREEFSKFLDNIFLQFDKAKFYTLIDDIMSHANTDEEIYRELSARVKEARPGAFEWIRRIWQGLTQLLSQMKGQAKNLMGEGQKANGFMEIGVGFAGRYVRPMQEVVNMSGKKVVMNVREEVADLLQCGFPRPRDLFLPLNNYDPISTQVKDRSIDLVTCWIGLHHVPEDKLEGFVQSIHRIMRPDGTFLLRDHDAGSERMKTLVSVVHSVFNAGLGGRISVEQELNEVRNFQSLDDWTSLLERNGFERMEGDPQIVEGDPTLNSMIRFRRIETYEDREAMEAEKSQETAPQAADPLEQLVRTITNAWKSFLEYLSPTRTAVSQTELETSETEENQTPVARPQPNLFDRFLIWIKGSSSSTPIAQRSEERPKILGY